MTTTKVAFTSCVDADEEQEQFVWKHIQNHKPDVLLLLGDMIYMDFSFALLGSKKPRGQHNQQSLQEFADKMYHRYRQQWAVETFKNLIGSGIKIELTWDDHDFAWNNCRGQGADPVKPEFRIISRSLFLQFKQQIQTGNPNLAYPDQLGIEQLLGTSPQPQSELSEGIQTVLDINDVRIVMFDGRTYRQDPTAFWSRAIGKPPAHWMHGEAQLNWMLEQFKDWPGHKVIGSGSTLNYAGETWSDFRDFQWMLDNAPQNSIVLTGDIHKNDGPNYFGKPTRFFEATASGAARPGVIKSLNISGTSGNYGILRLDQNAQVELYKYAQNETKKILY